MKVFTVNCGSSSIKYQLFSMTTETVLAKGLLERVGSEEALLRHTCDDTRHDLRVKAANHTEGIKLIIDALVDPKIGVISDVSEIEGVGHRVVHGGEQIKDSARIDQNVIDIIRRNIEVAPLHNGPNLAGIEGAMEDMPDVPHVAVFDTAFLSTLPPKAYRYAIPADWYVKHHVRKYGFHGTSHRYVTLRLAELLGKSPDEINAITVHLGNGCSMTAVAGGKAVDHSMGLTPLQGLVMGTRSGDIDPAIPLFMQARGLSAEEVDNALNKKSGLLGLSQCSNDMRDLLVEADKGNANAALAVEVFIYRVVKYIGSYHIVLPPLDAVVLTGGIGENSLPVRAGIVSGLQRLGAKLDHKRNLQMVGGKAGTITTDDSSLKVWIVPTNEELMIARDTRRLVTAVATR